MTLREIEAQLLKRIRAGDKSAYVDLVTPYKERLLRKAKSMLKDDDDAEDIVQDALISGYRSIGKFRADSGIYTWLYRIVVNRAKDLLTKRKRNPETSITEQEYQFADERDGYEKKLELSEESKYLIDKIKQLDEVYRQVIELRYFEELSYAEIATILGCNEGTVKSRLFKAKELLKHMILSEQKEGK